MSDEDRYTRITLRIPKALTAQLKSGADERSHSMNAEIIRRLEETFEPQSSLEVYQKFAPQVFVDVDDARFSLKMAEHSLQAAKEHCAATLASEEASDLEKEFARLDERQAARRYQGLLELYAKIRKEKPVQLSAEYKFKGRSVRVVKHSVLPDGTYFVEWESVDDGLPASGMASEYTFTSEAVRIG